MPFVLDQLKTYLDKLSGASSSIDSSTNKLKSTADKRPKPGAEDKTTNCLFIFGPETYIKNLCIREIEKYQFSSTPLSRDFDYDTFSAEESNVKQMCESLETLPVAAPKRLVCIRDIHHLTGSAWSELKKFIESPKSTQVILVLTSPSTDKRKAVIKDLLALAEVIPANTPKTNAQWIQWINWIAGKQGVSFPPEVALWIRQLTGYNLLSLENEIKKIKSLLTAKKTGEQNGKTVINISSEELVNLIPRLKPENVFALSKTLGQRKCKESLHSLNKLLEDKQNEMGVLSLISRHIRVLLRIKQSSGMPYALLSKKTGVPVFFISEYVEETKLWKWNQLARFLDLLTETDHLIKSQAIISKRTCLENLILKACNTK